MANNEICGSCKNTPCTCYEEKLAQEELLRVEELKDWERRNEEALSYHNDELCEHEAFELAHSHEIEDTPGVRRTRVITPRYDRPGPRPPRR